MREKWSFGQLPLFTVIFDEAQYLSKDAIEMLRYWNDRDRTTAPFPIGLVFIGNKEFALTENRSGQSIISGAVRSRALFIEELDYINITDADLKAFCKSRGIENSKAIAAFVRYFSKPRVKRDLRTAEQLLSAIRRRAGDKPVSAEIVDSILNP